MGYSIYIVALLIIAAVWKLGRKAEYGGDRLGRVVTIAVLLLSVAYLGSKALPRSVSYPFDLKEASRIAVSLDGRVQPLDSVARNNLLVISKMYAFRSDWLTWSQVKDFTALAAALVEGGKGKGTPAAHLWSILNDKERELFTQEAAFDEKADADKLASDIAKAPDDAGKNLIRRQHADARSQRKLHMLNALNRALDDEGRLSHADHHEEAPAVKGSTARFYDAAAWGDFTLDGDQKQFVAKLAEWDKRDRAAQLQPKRPATRPQVIDFNRQLLSAAFPKQVKASTRAEVPALVWMLDTVANREKAEVHRIFRIEHPRVLQLLSLEARPGSFRYAADEFRDKIDELDREANLAHRVSPKDRDDYQKAVTDLAEHLTRYMVLAQWGQPYWLPPQEGEKPDNWKTLRDAVREVQNTGQRGADVIAIAKFLQAYGDSNVGEFNEGVRAYNGIFAKRLEADAARASYETFFNRFDVFYHLTVLYVMVFLVVVISWLIWHKPDWARSLRKAAFATLIFLLIVHTYGLIARMYLQGRPPVTNLYASAIFIGWGVLILALIIEWITKLGVGSAATAMIGFITGIIAHHLRAEGDTLEMQQAVLDTNFWLATHVTTVTLGYAATYLAGVFALVFILGGVFTDAIDKEIRKVLAGMIYGVICFAMLFSFIGTVLGGIWADQSWGRFWGWDPKENGALMIVIWNALILHARWGGMVQARGVANLAIFGNIVTTWSWFGTNQLGAGLHSYGFMEQAVFWILVFVASQLVLIGIGMVPTRFWRSFNEPGQQPPSRMPGMVTAAVGLMLMMSLFLLAYGG